jgi:DNA-binding NtrC family response regulator
MEPVLIVEDEKTEAEELASTLKTAGYKYKLAGSVREAKEKLSKDNFSLVLVDYKLPDGTGNDLVRWAHSLKEKPFFYLMSAFSTVSRAVEACKLGASDFFEKPLERSKVLDVIKGIEKSEYRTDRSITKAKKELRIICAKDSPLEETLRLASIVADKTCNVFIYGESGTGKEIVAHLIHNLSPAAQGPLVSVNCSAIPDNLIESELFGYKKGAFTGACQDFKGRIQQAHGGTLFLDEIGDMPIHIQTKLLRALQEKAVTPIGSQLEVSLDFRLICATHHNLTEAVERGTFREDLYYRVNVIRIDIPPLRDRCMDIHLLAQNFLEDYLPGKKQKLERKDLPSVFYTHLWLGNVRELKNMVERYTVMREMGKSWEDVFNESHFISGNHKGPVNRLSGKETVGSPMPIRLTEKEIMEGLEKCGYHRERTAKYLGISTGWQKSKIHRSRNRF